MKFGICNRHTQTQKKKTSPKPQQIERWSPNKYYYIWKLNESRTVVKTLLNCEWQTVNAGIVLWMIMKLTVLCDFKSNEKKKKTTFGFFRWMFDIFGLTTNCAEKYEFISVNSHSERKVDSLCEIHCEKWNKYCKDLSQSGISERWRKCLLWNFLVSLWWPELKALIIPSSSNLIILNGKIEWTEMVAYFSEKNNILA